MVTNAGILVLDAMGVIYPVGDDVKDLLCPFIAEKGGCTDAERIRELYLASILGKLSNSQFWREVDIDPELEDEYLKRFTLTEGLLSFLQNVNDRGYKVWCLSNDVSEWAKKLRTRFQLRRYFAGFVISGDVGIRKPDPSIHKKFLTDSCKNAADCLFIDDSQRNLDSAASLGFKTVLFKPAGDLVSNNHQVAMSFNDLTLLLS